ncbi:lipoprotein signal peptidase [Ureaplasma diversum]|uniref:lipoprotein signal peptidase n=1 Tax=Ureaplasma diversum TaxID=42094 RepID=UPI000ADCDACB|nr:lipoprotein signal peptidase [Ureaplasma diversum]
MITKIKNSSLGQKITAFNNKLDQHILFKKAINKIKKLAVRNYFLSICSLKVIFWKLINLTWIAILVMVSGFLVRQFAIDLVVSTNQKDHGSIFSFTINNGVALGSLGNADVGLVYFLQTLPIVIGSLAFLFVKDSYFYIPLLFLLFGGMGNIIDRSIPEYELVGIKGFSDDPNQRGGNVIFHGVVDYWRFANSVINIFDVYIVTGICVLIFFLILNIVIKWNEEKKKENKEKDEDTPEWISKAASSTDTEIVSVDNKPFGWDDKNKEKQPKPSNEDDEE